MSITNVKFDQMLRVVFIDQYSGVGKTSEAGFGKTTEADFIQCRHKGKQSLFRRNKNPKTVDPFKLVGYASSFVEIIIPDGAHLSHLLCSPRKHLDINIRHHRLFEMRTKRVLDLCGALIAHSFKPSKTEIVESFFPLLVFFTSAFDDRLQIFVEFDTDFDSDIGDIVFHPVRLKVFVVKDFLAKSKHDPNHRKHFNDALEIFLQTNFKALFERMIKVFEISVKRSLSSYLNVEFTDETFGVPSFADVRKLFLF
jgi:hypothetical protein